MIERLSFGFQNPNHAAAMLCAWLPLFRGWRWAKCGELLSVVLVMALLATQSRTGLLVAGLEMGDLEGRPPVNMSE